MKRVYLFLTLGLGFIAPACFATPYGAWVWHNPFPTANNLTGVAYGSGTGFSSYLAVDNSGAIFSSQDGLVWTEQSVGTNTLTGVCFGNGVFVAVGGTAGGSGVVLTSSDGGNTWTENDSVTSFLNAVAYGNNEFVAVGNGAATGSSDGQSWTNQVGAPAGMNGVAYGAAPGDFVAVGNGGNVYYSPNGVNWTAASSGVSYELYGVAYGIGTFQDDGGYGHFVAVGDSTIITSLTASDVSAWSLSSSSDFGSAVAYGGTNMFVSVDIDHRPGTFVSTDNGYTFTLANSSIQPPYADAITYGNGQFVAVGDTGVIAVSVDASNWTEASYSATTQPLDCGAYSSNLANGSFPPYVIAGGESFGGPGLILYSFDGELWTLDTDPSVYNTGYPDTSVLTSVGPTGLVWGNGQFVGVGTAYNGLENGVSFHSTDGLTWQTNLACTNRALNGITYGAGTYVAVGGETAIAYSSDGTNWADTSLSTNLYTTLNGVTYGNGEFVAVGDGVLSAVSPDGIHWTTNDYPPGFSDTNFDAVAYGNGLFVAVGGESYDTNRIWTSTDGLNWAQQTNFHTYYANLDTIAYVNGFFIAAGGGGVLLSSADGVNWASQLSGTENDFANIFFGGNQITAVGASGTIIGTTLPPPITETNLNFVQGVATSFGFGVPNPTDQTVTVYIEASTNLSFANWAVVEVTNIPPSGTLYFSAPASDSSMCKFYRAICLQ